MLVRIRARVEIEADGLDRRVVDVGKGLKAIGDDGQHTVILIVGESVEKFVFFVKQVVQAAETFNFAEKANCSFQSKR